MKLTNDARVNLLHLENVARAVAHIVVKNHEAFPEMNFTYAKAKNVIKRARVLIDIYYKERARREGAGDE